MNIEDIPVVDVDFDVPEELTWGYRWVIHTDVTPFYRRLCEAYYERDTRELFGYTEVGLRDFDTPKEAVASKREADSMPPLVVRDGKAQML
jgi:hypothetical protein